MRSLAERRYIKPDIFDDQDIITAGFSTRHGGVSQAPFNSLNLGLSTEDAEGYVLKNRQLLFESVGFSLDQLAITGQVHGTKVREVGEQGLYRGFDGLVTRKPGLLLCLSAADCASVLIADARHQVVGACHAGWRGTVGNIVSETVDLMEKCGAHASDMRAYVSPCISVKHFEVGPEVEIQFHSTYVHRVTGKEKSHIDLKKALFDQLLEKGLDRNRIEISVHCTYDESQDFYSYRAEQGNTGRMMGFIGMRY